MKHKLQIAPVILIALALPLLQGCGTTPVAKAQQVTHLSAVNLKDFADFERNNRQALWNINPGIKHFTDNKLRARECDACKPNAERYVESAIAMVDAYKDNRTPANKASLDTAIAVIQELINQISDYFLNPQIAALNHATAAKYKNVKVAP